MELWSYKLNGYDANRVVEDGNRFLIANGYMGYRGTLEEACKDAYPAVNLAGVYDRYENLWREPVNAPNSLYFNVCVNGKTFTLGKTDAENHSIGVDYRNGIFTRETDFGIIKINSRRIASMAQPHLLCESIKLSFTEDCDVELNCGIDADVWDINGPHLFGHKFEEGSIIKCSAVSGEKEITVAVAQAVNTAFPASENTSIGNSGIFRNIAFSAESGIEYTIDIFGTVYTSLDTENPGTAAELLAENASANGFESVINEHTKAWNSIWENCSVDIEGCEEAARAVHASQYHLNSIAPRHSSNLSIPARGLSGQTYKGAVFWDTEVFLFPMFVYTQPEIARSFLRYRIDTINGARKKAKEYGYRGAFYAWESQEGGEEGCTNFNVVDVFTHRPVRTYFRDKQIHISGDVAYTMRRYYEITGDRSLLENGGAEVILECARFYISRASAAIDKPQIDLTDVIGPDEYHERVTNNAFTNLIAFYTVESAILLKEIFSDKSEFLSQLTQKLDYNTDWNLLNTLSQRLKKPSQRNGVIEQFDGYFDLEDCSLADVRSRLCHPREYWGGDHGVAGTTQIIKQADVIAMMAMFPERFTEEEIEKNWTYYEPRTEHGSSLSACMYALTACRIGQPDKAWELFMKTANIDITGSSKQWAGDIYIGGTHPASNGGAWMIAVLGFAGMHIENDELHFTPHLPKQISKIHFPVTYRGNRLSVTVTRDAAVVEKVQ